METQIFIVIKHLNKIANCFIVDPSNKKSEQTLESWKIRKELCMGIITKFMRDRFSTSIQQKVYHLEHHLPINKTLYGYYICRSIQSILSKNTVTHVIPLDTIFSLCNSTTIKRSSILSKLEHLKADQKMMTNMELDDFLNNTLTDHANLIPTISIN